MIFLKKTKRQKYLNRGFTLIEIMVATSIFIVIMLAALGSLLVASNHAKKSKALRLAMDNVNYAMETMSRTIRLGSHYDCNAATYVGATGNTDCYGGSKIGLWSYSNTTSQVDTVFQLVPVGGIGVLQKCTSLGCVNLTSPEVDVRILRFVTRGSSQTDGVQPSTAILMKGIVTVNGQISEFALQTLASQRNYE